MILRQQGLRIPVYPISCGVDLNRFHPDHSVDRVALRKRYGLDPNRNIVLFVGRVDGEKRIDVLIRAIRQLPRDDVQLAVAGKGAAFKDLQRLAQELNLGDKVHFTGFVPDEDLPALLNSVDIFSMPSEAELLSIATLEAMASARPVLAARAQALPELVSPEKNGYLFNPGDASDAAEKLSWMLTRKDRWDNMQANSLKKALNHSLENTVHRYEEVYDLILAQQTSPKRVRSGKKRFKQLANPTR